MAWKKLDALMDPHRAYMVCPVRATDLGGTVLCKGTVCLRLILLTEQQRVDSLHDPASPIHDPAFVEDQETGRPKFKIEYIQDKSSRDTSFSKRKEAIMRKAHELSTLTGAEVLVIIFSETGLGYVFSTDKLRPLVTEAECKSRINACINTPHSDSKLDVHASAQDVQV